MSQNHADFIHLNSLMVPIALRIKRKLLNTVYKSPHDLASTYFLDLQLNTVQHILWIRRSNTLSFLRLV